MVEIVAHTCLEFKPGRRSERQPARRSPPDRAALNPHPSEGSQWDFCPRNVPQHQPQGPLCLPGRSCSALPTGPLLPPGPGLGTAQGGGGGEDSGPRGVWRGCCDGPMAPQAPPPKVWSFEMSNSLAGWVLCPACSSHRPGGGWPSGGVCQPLPPP